MTFITRRHRSIKAFVKASLICFVIYKFFPSNIIFETFEIRQIVMNEFYIYFLIKKKKTNSFHHETFKYESRVLRKAFSIYRKKL